MPQLGNLALAIALILAVYSIVANVYGAGWNAPDFVVSARWAYEVLGWGGYWAWNAPGGD